MSAFLWQLEKTFKGLMWGGGPTGAWPLGKAKALKSFHFNHICQFPWTAFTLLSSALCRLQCLQLSSLTSTILPSQEKKTYEDWTNTENGT